MSDATTATVSPAREKFESLPKTYTALLGLYQPRVPAGDTEAAALTSVIATMTGFALTVDQEDFLKLLVTLNSQWRRVNPKYKRATPAMIVAAMMDEHGLDLAGMGKVLGIPKSGVSMIVNGERELSKESIRKMAARFSLEPGALIGDMSKPTSNSAKKTFVYKTNFTTSTGKKIQAKGTPVRTTKLGTMIKRASAKRRPA